MNDVSMLASEAIRSSQHQPEQRGESPLIRKLFLLLHGSYGNQFASKFSTGEKDSNGKDKGIRAAMMVWDNALRKYPAEVVETAAGRLQKEHPEFPPNLPQFEKLCDAAMPRKSYAEEQGLPALPAPVIEPVKVDLTKHNDGKDWARNLVERVQRGDKSVRPVTLKWARQALGMEGRQAWQ